MKQVVAKNNNVQILYEKFNLKTEATHVLANNLTKSSTLFTTGKKPPGFDKMLNEY